MYAVRPKHGTTLCCAYPQDIISINLSILPRQYCINGTAFSLDGIGPDDINIEALLKRLDTGGVQEVILAIQSSVEGKPHLTSSLNNLKTLISL